MTVIKVKRATASDWKRINPILEAGEAGLEKDTGQVKYGDGLKPWDELPYAGNDYRVLTADTLPTLTPSAIVNQFNITAQADDLVIANPAPDDFFDGQSLIIRVKDNGVAKSITWDTYYRAVGVTLPIATVVGKILYIGAKWNAVETTFDVIAVGVQA